MNDIGDARPWPRLGVWRIALIAGTVAALGALEGCQNPFATTQEDLGEQAPRERLRVIEPLKLDEVTSSRRSVIEATGSLDAPPDPFAGMKEVPLTLEQARAATITNNLNLKVSLVDPLIAAERVTEEEARFEAVLFTNARFAHFDQPTSSTLQSGQFQDYQVVPGVRIPLRTGGTVQVELPVERQSTDNIFTDPALRTSYTSDARFSISQPLLRNAGRRAATYPIRIQALESQISQAQAKLEVIRRVADADRGYWLLYATQKLLEVRQAQYELAKEQLERAERRVRARSAPEIEIVRAQSGVANSLEQIILSQNEVKQAQRNLKRIMNLPGLDVGSEAVFELGTQPDPVRYELDPKLLAAEAVTDRMEMLQLELRLAQDYSTIEFTKNQALPLFVLDYSYTVNGLGRTLNSSFDLLRDDR
ncbi:MAG TPA: TolC family protein, partial [Phycisphaerales bacterium]|nr:TolC family protein [Phycisphaerales bacterium]